jgi:branched-chain amino acid transport system permease protein
MVDVPGLTFAGKVIGCLKANRADVLAAIVLILVPVVSGVLKDPYILAKATQLVIFAVAAISLDLILRPAGLISLGHAGFFGLGAYVVGILISHDVTNGFLHIFAVIVVCGAAAAVVGLIALKTRGVFFIMITLAFGQMLFYLASSLSRYGGDDGFTIWSGSIFGSIDLSNQFQLYCMCAVVLMLCYAMSLTILHSPFGRVLLASKESEARVASLGYDVYVSRLIAFVIAGAMAGVAGALLANHTDFISPSYMSWMRSAELLVMVILGGLRSTMGAVVGAVMFILIQDGLSEMTTHWQGWFGIVMVVIAFWRTDALSFRRRLKHA